MTGPHPRAPATVAIITDGNGRWRSSAGAGVGGPSRRRGERPQPSARRCGAGRRAAVDLRLLDGGRAEIVDAARGFTGTTEAEFAAHLCAPELRPPEVVIRTGGERRISNYLIWHIASSQLVFRDELWPDFTRESLLDALAACRSGVRTLGDG